MPPKEDFSLKKTSPKIGGGRVAGSQSLTTSYDLIEQMNYLFVKVCRARDFPENCVPFVEVKIGNYKGTTKYLENQPNLEWNQVFAFKKQQIQDTVVNILVRDRQYMNDEIIGCINFTLATDVINRVQPDNTSFAPEWYRLLNKNGVRVSGELMLSVWNGTQTDEAFANAWHSDSTAVSGEGIVTTRAKVYMSPKLWYLRVKVIQAQDLVPKAADRTPEVFVKAIFGDLVLRTKISSDKNLDPKWNEELMFVAAEPFDDPLILSVEDKYEANNEECLGKLIIPLSNVARRNLPVAAAPAWYNLQRHVVEGEQNTEVRFASKLNMEISLDGGYHVFDEPFHYSSDLRAPVKSLWPGVIGVLEVGILNAKGLTAMKSKDGRGTTDAYCVAKYGQKWAKTRTIVNSLEPQWNEQYTWEVYDLCTVITIGVFDNVHLGGNNVVGAKDQLIGRVRIRLSTLDTDTIYTYSYPLSVLQPNGLKKMGEIGLAVRFTCSINPFSLLLTYNKIPLPKMHYSHPLSVHQLDKLRSNAAHVVSLRLGRAEPPLRKEVVECMLDIGQKGLWSMRRGRANLARIMGLFNAFADIWKWFEKICKWENYTQTIMVHILFTVGVYSPDRMLCALLLLCVIYSLRLKMIRPKDPPHMDIKLSHADLAHPDELDEELDTFPSSKTGEVLKVRYDRLRIIGGRGVAILGDFANQVERLESLFSWRDPRATTWALIFCVIAFILIAFIPFRLLLLGLGFYVMRYPAFPFLARTDMPTIPENILRRFPSRIDSML